MSTGQGQKHLDIDINLSDTENVNAQSAFSYQAGFHINNDFHASL